MSEAEQIQTIISRVVEDLKNKEKQKRKSTVDKILDHLNNPKNNDIAYIVGNRRLEKRIKSRLKRDEYILEKQDDIIILELVKTRVRVYFIKEK